MREIYILSVKASLKCVVFASIMVGAIALLSSYQSSQDNLDVAATAKFMPSGWHQFVAITGLIVPIIVWVIHFNHPLIHTILTPYLVVLWAQIITEIIILQWFGRGMSVVIGTLYSTFRLIQLWQGHKLVRESTGTHRWFQVGLGILFVIWAINLANFLLFRWPQILKILL